MRKARKILSLAVCISMLLTVFFPQGIKAEAQEDGESAVLNESTKTYEEGALVTSEPVFTISDIITPGGAQTLLSPDGSVKINFWLENSVAYYNVFKNSTAVVLNSKLGIDCGEAGNFADGFTSVTDAVTSSSNTVWTPVVGEQASIRNNYNKLSVKLAHSSGNVLGIEFCAYDEGAAFRYVLPSAEPGKEYIISDEYTQIALPTADGTFAAVHQNGSQTAANKIATTAFSSSITYQRPMAVSYANGYAMTIAEVKVQDYRVMTLSGADQSGVLKVTQPKPMLPRDISSSASTVTVDENGPGFTPWRVFVIVINDAELPQNEVIIENLNDPADEEIYEYSSWVKEGPNLRAGIGTDRAKSGIDQAAEHGIPYILLDTGCDPRLDPSLLDPSDPYYDILSEYIPSEGVFNTNGKTFNTYGTLLDETTSDYKMSVNIDIPEVCRYGKEKGVGVILYVNGVFFPDDRFTADELFSHFAEWGVAGVKPGFVGARTQELENTMVEVIKAAAKNKLSVI